jgi:hypothetical protein
MAASSHGEYLDNLCRTCGKRQSKFKAAVNKVKEVSVYAEKIKEVFDTDVNFDNPNVHPKRICNSCYAKLFRGNTKQHTVTWHPHTDENCKVCNLYLQQSKGGRPSNPVKGLVYKLKSEHKKHFDKLESCNNVSIDMDDQFKATSDILNCPVCNKFVSFPMKAGCNHIFCLKCIKQLTKVENKENRNCPKCKKPLIVAKIEPLWDSYKEVIEHMCVQCTKCQAKMDARSTKSHCCTTDEEEQIATRVLKRKLAESEDGTCVTFKTRGQVLHVLQKFYKLAR